MEPEHTSFVPVDPASFVPCCVLSVQGAHSVAFLWDNSKSEEFFITGWETAEMLGVLLESGPSGHGFLALL